MQSYVIGVALAGVGAQPLVRFQPVVQPSRDGIAVSGRLLGADRDHIPPRLPSLVRSGVAATPEAFASSAEPVDLGGEVPSAVLLVGQAVTPPAELPAGGFIDASAPLVDHAVIISKSHCFAPLYGPSRGHTREHDDITFW
ncbi:hypothetical protein [Spongiactinospora rosea]|uniref:hypothetical protein n=1 Tax=Spongiactinospora rosea TaxID=2248750 RepID=UPI001CEC8DA3|nr:hypothetical protein [Spongiactinospora rosea]